MDGFDLGILFISIVQDYKVFNSEFKFSCIFFVFNYNSERSDSR